MQLSEEEFQSIKNYIISEGKRIYDEIKAKYANYLKSDNKRKSLEQNNGKIMVHQYEEEDIKLFGGIKKVPPGHSGRKKQDNIIHVYPYSPQLSFVKDIKLLIQILINDIIIHEIFHFYIQPDLYDSNDIEHGDDVWFGHRLTEGIVQYFTNKYIKEHELAKSYTTYIEEVLLVENIVQDLKDQGKTEEEIMLILLNDNQHEIIDKCTNGKQIKKCFIAKTKLHQKINQFLRNVLTNLQNDINEQEIYHSYVIMTDVDEIYNSLVTQFPTYRNELEEIFFEYQNETKKVL